MFYVALWTAALLAAWALPDEPVGVGVVVVAAVVGTAVLARRPRLRPSDLGLGVLGFALVVPCMFITADWVLALDLLAAGGIGAVAVGRAETWSALVGAGLGVVANLGRGLALTLAPLTSGVRLRRGAGVPLVARGIALGSSLVALFGTLFITADAAFARLAANVFVPDWNAGLLPARVLVALLVLAFGGGYALLAEHPPDDEKWSWGDPFRARRTLPRAEWAPALALVNALFLAFVAVQVTVLFGGRDYVLRTTGLTYAQYARSGFFQLVAVALLTLLLIALAVRWAERSGTGDRLLLQGLLGLLCALTLIILVSAFKRLNLYEQTYGYTRLRVFIDLVILWLAVVFALVMVAGALWRARWLPRAVVAVTGLSLLAFSAANPDVFIARRSVERYFESGRLDADYVATLSADAAPALDALSDPLRECVLRVLDARLDQAPGFWGFNFARERAVQVLERVDAAPRAACPPALPPRSGLIPP